MKIKNWNRMAWAICIWISLIICTTLGSDLPSIMNVFFSLLGWGGIGWMSADWVNEQ